MRMNSEYPSSSFQKHIIKHPSCELHSVDVSHPLPETGSIADDNDKDSHSNSSSSESSEDDGDIAGNDTDDSKNCNSSSSKSSVVGNDDVDDSSMFSFPEDISEYTLDISGNISNDLKKTQKEKKRKKDEEYGFFNVSKPPEKTKEKIIVGDEILYVPPIFVQGNAHTNCERRMATVLSVNADAEYKMEISTGDLIPDDIQIKRTKIMKDNNLVTHPGVFRQVSSFVLDTQQSLEGSSLTIRKLRNRRIINAGIKKAIKKAPKQLKGLMKTFCKRQLG